MFEVKCGLLNFIQSVLLNFCHEEGRRNWWDAISTFSFTSPLGDLSYIYAHLDKSGVLQEARVFNETPIKPSKCCLILSKVLFLMQQGEPLHTQEATDLFFSVTKLFQSKDVSVENTLKGLYVEIDSTKENGLFSDQGIVHSGPRRYHGHQQSDQRHEWSCGNWNRLQIQCRAHAVYDYRCELSWMDWLLNWIFHNRHRWCKQLNALSSKPL